MGPLYAQTEITSEDQFFEDITIGSDEDFFEISIEPSTVDEERVPKNFSMSGSFSQGVIYGIANPGGRFLREVKGVESLKSELFLQSQGRQSDNVKIKVSGVAQYEWGEWVNDAYSLGGSDIELELRDLFVDIAQESGVWIRVGNQIIARSQIDTLKITDVVNPLDLSTPGLVDFKDLRIQVPAVLLSAPVGNTNVELIAIYDGGGNKNAPLAPESNSPLKLTKKLSKTRSKKRSEKSRKKYEYQDLEKEKPHDRSLNHTSVANTPELKRSKTQFPATTQTQYAPKQSMS